MKFKSSIYILLLIMPSALWAQNKISVSEVYASTAFPLVHQQKVAPIFIDVKDAEVVSIATDAFKNDINLLTGLSPMVNKWKNITTDYAVFIGTIGQSFFIDELAKSKKINLAKIIGKWETFSISVVENPIKGVKRGLVIAGSDRRGTAFGVFELSKMLGVSPLNWWADVKPAQKKAIYINPGESIVGPPSVKYRGIFINDEDWGLQPWAAKKMDTDVKDIGPKTYAKVFELLLRLKANYIWPAMHPSTKAFFYYKDSPKIADQYAIVLGGSHCEPLLRNNVFEWAENFEHEYGKKPGEWRFDLNKAEMNTYWADRVKEAKNYEAVYTVGMRGIHDGSMPGPKDRKEKVKLLDEVIQNQRNILADNLAKPITTVPQIFCPYKEVLTLYQSGLKLPDDVTIVWSDDNHGYIRQLSNSEEQKRSGGSGVYYHLSYWGAPHDYLWLSSISPSLISYELTKAYQHKADRLWVFNVGDIKPAEMEIQFSMDLAWDVNAWKPDNAHKYVESWARETFGDQYAKPIAEIKETYYRLAQSAKPEHMSSVNFIDKEADKRLADYQYIFNKAKALGDKMPERLKDAYFELIQYPVEGAYLMNQKILYAKKSILYASYGHKEALVYAQKAKDAFNRIKEITKKYNKEMAGGKWDGIMDYRPRKLPVFDMPKVAENVLETEKPVEGNSINSYVNLQDFIPKNIPLGYNLKLINGLGITGKSISILPLNLRSFSESELDKAPQAIYSVPNFANVNTVIVKCLPTQGVTGGVKVRYAIAVNDDKPQIVTISPASENDVWKMNVLQGFAQGITNHKSTSLKKNSTIKIYMLDPGLAINQIEIK